MIDNSTSKARLVTPRITLRRLAIWVSLGLVILAGVTSLILTQGISRQLSDITDTYAVREKASELMIALGEAEANQRGYLLTHDPQFLGPYNSSIDGIETYVAALLDMTADDPAQSRRVVGIIDDIESKLTEMAQAVETVDDQRAVDAPSMAETDGDVRLMVEVRRTLDSFIAEENQKLAERNSAIAQSRNVLAAVMIAALCAAAILAYALLTRTQRQVSALALRHQGLLSQNEALEAEVQERTRAIEEARAHAEHERERVEALLQDANHRIGNSLATVSSLLALQLMRTKSSEVKAALEAARMRVHAVASAHRRLRLGADMESTETSEFLEAVVEDIMQTQTVTDRVTITSEIEEIEIGARDATTLGILVGELVTNALKHAFPGEGTGKITVKLALVDDIATLTIADTGVGLSDGHPNGNGMGSLIIQQLSGQFGGAPQYSGTPGGGLTVTIPLPQLTRSHKTDNEG